MGFGASIIGLTSLTGRDGHSESARAERVRARGLTRVGRVLSRRTAERLRDFVHSYFEDVMSRIQYGLDDKKDHLGKTLYAEQRFDLLLPIEGAVLVALHEVVANLGDCLKELVTPEAELVELAALVSEPGSARQRMHPDTMVPYGVEARARQTRPPILTVFVALQDVDLAMGPTIMVPNTHFPEAHDFLNRLDPSARDKFLFQLGRKPFCSKAMALKEGQGVMMDSRLWHAGASNVSDRRRTLFYLSLHSPLGYSRGSTLSIRPEQAGKWTLSTILEHSAIHSPLRRDHPDD